MIECSEIQKSNGGKDNTYCCDCINALNEVPDDRMLYLLVTYCTICMVKSEQVARAILWVWAEMVITGVWK